MNYRHIYHAGNFADVFKHIVLMLALEHLRKKEKGFFALDTHAGTGKYDLESEQAGRTGEALEGIGKLWGQKNLPDIAARYLSIVRELNRGKDLKIYPGSPLIMQKFLRPQDRMAVNELHPDDVRTLRKTMGNAPNLRVENMDGYAVLKAFVPPLERRGLVLIDPPFEVRDEFCRMVEALRQAYRRWATGMYLFWYPIKDMKDIVSYHKAIAGMGISDCQAFDFTLRPVKDSSVLNGCGMLAVNPPWTLKTDLQTVMPALVQILTDSQGAFRETEIAAEA